MRVKIVDGSIIGTHDSLETRVREGEMSIPYRLQLVSKQVDLKGDGILGRDLLKATRALSRRWLVCVCEFVFKHEWCSPPLGGDRVQGGGKMNILNVKKIYFLHSVNFK